MEGLEFKEEWNCKEVINQQIGMEAKVSEGERAEEKVGQELMVVESSKTGTLQEHQLEKLKKGTVMQDV